MSLAAHLCNFTTLTPPELSRADSPAARERRKNSQARAEDFIYTLNHAITCLSLTDFIIAPFFASVFGWNICGHGHDHGKDGAVGPSHGWGIYSRSSSSSHVHGPGCAHDYSSSSASFVARSSTPTAAAMPPASAAATETVKAPATHRIGGGMRRSRATWKGSAPSTSITPPKPIFGRGMFTNLQDNSEVGEEGRVFRPASFCNDVDCAIPEHASDFVGPPKPASHVPTPSPSPSYSYSYSSYTPNRQKTFGEKISLQWAKAKHWVVGKLNLNTKAMKEWVIGEALGDLGAVPVTLAVQHFTPGIMTGIQHGLEPIVGRMMHRRAEKAAARWADSNGIARDAREVVDHAESLYQYEIRHLPQMVMWTLSSVGINYGVMKFRNPELTAANFAKGKVAGAAITAGLVFGTRSLAPDKAHAWDTTVSRKLVVPVVKKVGRVFGIEEEDVDAFHKHQQTHGAASWADKVKAAPESPAVGVA